MKYLLIVLMLAAQAAFAAQNDSNHIHLRIAAADSTQALVKYLCSTPANREQADCATSGYIQEYARGYENGLRESIIELLPKVKTCDRYAPIINESINETFSKYTDDADLKGLKAALLDMSAAQCELIAYENTL